MKILYVTTIGGTMTFFKKHIKMLQEKDCSVDLACSTVSPVRKEILELNVKVHNICFSRNPLASDNFKAYKELKKIVTEGGYDIVHCHTPNAAAITRFACKNLRKKGLKVIYTAHGFHFYKGAPLKNWILFYPIEWICAHWTDSLITINKEDYALAQKHMHAKKIEYIPGVGVDLKKFSLVDEVDKAKRISIGVPKKARMILSVGELNENKNHQVIIKAMSQIKDDSIHYVIAGEGNQKENLLSLAKNLGISDRVHLLGFRNDVAELYGVADVYALPSIREGLNVSIMEAMASELPVICSKIRGNVDLIDENGGELYEPLDCEEAKIAIKNVFSKSYDKRKNIGKYNAKKVYKFSDTVVLRQLKQVYDHII